MKLKLTSIWIFILITAVYCCAIGVDTMDEDASQYASMSREMKVSGSYLQVYDLGKDYLDKPPFLFWVNALSMKMFGENNFAYKLPSILFALLSIFATYRLARLFYEEEIAKLASIVLATSQALFLITNDIRTDTILMGWVITALWLLAEWIQSGKALYFLFGCLAIGGGMITKGPIALFVPIFALGSHFIMQRKFTYLWKPIYLLGILVIGIVLLPMSLGLYQQFDLHPEKTVNGAQNVSGLRFFYWTQSFGRITGESKWDNNAPFSFLFENLLWGMLPWTFFFIAALLHDWMLIIKKKFRINDSEEWITTGGFLITYCSLAMSNYQLPHYIYVVLPLLSISTAKMMHRLWWENKGSTLNTIVSILQVIIILALVVLPFAVLQFVFPAHRTWPWFVAVLPSLLVLLVISWKKIKSPLFYSSLAVILAVNIFLSTWFYPQLLQHQAGNVVGRIISDLKVAEDQFFLYQFTGSARNIHFYSKRIVRVVATVSNLKSGTYLLTMDKGIHHLKNSGRKFTILHEGQDFHVTTLTGGFLNKATRPKHVRTYYLVKLDS